MVFFLNIFLFVLLLAIIKIGLGHNKKYHMELVQLCLVKCGPIKVIFFDRMFNNYLCQSCWEGKIFTTNTHKFNWFTGEKTKQKDSKETNMTFLLDLGHKYVWGMYTLLITFVFTDALTITIWHYYCADPAHQLVFSHSFPIIILV